MAEVKEPSPAQPGYGIGAMARRLGVAPATLRDWERRYGIGPGGRTAGGHRRYRPADVARIEAMRRLILDGVPPGEAARVALAEGDPAPPGAGSGGPGGTGRGRAVAAVAQSAASGPGPGPRGPGPRRPGHRPGTRALAAGAGRRGYLGTARRAGADRGRRAKRGERVLHRRGAPAIRPDGGRPRRPGGRLGVPLNTRTVLLACADGEQHSLALYALAAALAEREVGTTMLGPRTPPPALAEAISRIGPAAAFVWSQTAETGDPAQLADIPRQRPPLRLFIAGPGWQGTPAGGQQVATLSEAVQQACEAVGAA